MSAEELNGNQYGLSIIVPTLNEVPNIRPLIKRIDQAMQSHKISYEIILIDDHSPDGTLHEAVELSSMYPLLVYSKQGNAGKAQSLLEGFFHAKYPILAMIDADLQYPPEYLGEMLEQYARGSDIVIANRIDQQISLQRKLASIIFRKIFGHFLHGLNFDIQSGMKLFKGEILNQMTIKPTPWTFDLEFLVKAKNLGYSIASIDIPFSDRTAGESKVSLVQTSKEIAWSSLWLKLTSFSFNWPKALLSDTLVSPNVGWKGGRKSASNKGHNEEE